MDNRRRLVGELAGLDRETVKLRMDGQDVSVDMRNVDSARLKPMV